MKEVYLNIIKTTYGTPLIDTTRRIFSVSSRKKGAYSHCLFSKFFMDWRDGTEIKHLWTWVQFLTSTCSTDTTELAGGAPRRST